jgi:prolyl-tRNA editing enzyme YbaK/EbsC (Cys-tRNA(Pro) deacylase)
VAYERAKEYLKSKGLEDHIIIPEHSSATVAEAAEALGCEPGMIAKTLSFLQGDKAVLILAEGMARIDNKKYKARFGCKAKMIPHDQVEELVGHDVGGVCPFGVNPDVTIYLDESLKQHTTVYPAAGTDHSAVRLTIEELELACNDAPWIDVCKDPDAGDSLS